MFRCWRRHRTVEAGFDGGTGRPGQTISTGWKNTAGDILSVGLDGTSQLEGEIVDGMGRDHGSTMTTGLPSSRRAARVKTVLSNIHLKPQKRKWGSQ